MLDHLIDNGETPMKLVSFILCQREPPRFSYCTNGLRHGDVSRCSLGHGVSVQHRYVQLLTRVKKTIKHQPMLVVNLGSLLPKLLLVTVYYQTAGKLGSDHHMVPLLDPQQLALEDRVAPWQVANAAPARCLWPCRLCRPCRQRLTGWGHFFGMTGARQGMDKHHFCLVG